MQIKPFSARVSRRGLLKNAGAFFAGVASGSVASSIASATTSPSTGQPPPLSWPYVKLDPETVAETAYHAHYKGGCCYAVFESIVGELRQKIGAPYTMLPTTMMIFGEGGIAGIGSVCGTLNGAAMVIFLLTGKVEKEKRETAFGMTQDIFNWYAQTPLPDHKPAQPKFEIVKSVCRSNLCHVSMTKWCKTAKCKTGSKERSERCAWLSASVAKQTVKMLNAHFEGSFKAVHKLPAEAQSCRDCHDKGSALENIRTTTDCGSCHFTQSSHPKL